jgi:hypothetical protein
MKIRFEASIQLRKLVGLTLLVLGWPLYGQQRATILSFDPPDSPSPSQTFPQSINPAGVVTGYYNDVNSVPQGFLRARDGTFIPFDPLAPGLGSLAALNPQGQGTTPLSINLAGAITGYYLDVNFVAHGFLRAPNGIFTNIDPPGSLSCNPIAINPAGAITGNYADGNTGLNRGFLRSPNGIVTSIDPPGSQSSNGTHPRLLIRRERSRVFSKTQTLSFPASGPSCGLPTVPLPASILRRTLPPRAPNISYLRVLTRRE